MKKQLRFLITALAALVLGGFLLFLINQIAGVYVLAAAVNPGLGTVVLVALIALFTALLATPLVLYFRLPQSLPPPQTEAEIAPYHQKLARRLAAHPRLQSLTFDLTNEAGLHLALAQLETEADAIIRRSAQGVFLTTAVSQNGKLDALTVFITQTKMVWDVAHVYHQRPSPRDLINLYANVGAATFLATAIEDMDLSEQLEPVLGTVFQGSALKSVPFVGSVSAVVMDSLLEGTVNAFLTLRVGVVTKRYCGALTPFNATQARKAAYAEASGMLRGLVVQLSGQVAGAVGRAARKAGVGAVQSGLRVAGKATQRVGSSFFSLFRRNPPGSEAAPNP